MYKEHGVGWLSSKSEVMGLLSYAAAAGPSGSSRFLEAYIEKGHATLTCFSTEGEYSRITMGIEMIGTGSETYDSIAPRFADILNFAGPGKKGVATAQRALLLSGWIWEASKTRSIESVGGLMQVHFVEKGGIRAIPYRRWVDVGGGYGTYVTMALDAEGAWVQIHGPTGLRVPLRFPGEPDFGEAGGASVNFELERQLDKDSPGVIPTPDIVQAYELFSDETGVIAGVPSGSGVARLQISPETL
jgi:hypothetical protein